MSEERVSSRHEGDVGGTLEKFSSQSAISVRVVIPETVARRADAQHTAWMLINLLTRADGIINRIALDCPTGISLQDRVVPFGNTTLLLDRLMEAAALIGIVEVVSVIRGQDKDEDQIVIIGDDSMGISGAMLVWGSAWWGGVHISNSKPQIRWLSSSDCDLPFGPYIAAALAVAQIFLDVRLPLGAHRERGTYGWDCWDQKRSALPGVTPHISFPISLDGVALAGAGAVGTAWMHAMWAVRGVIGEVVVADSDHEGVSTSNLNRRVLFVRGDLGSPKAMVASLAVGGRVKWTPHFRSFEDLDLKPLLLVCAVDTTKSRASIQSRYPARLLVGSTRDFRAEVRECGPPGEGACLRCFNAPEPEISDDDLRRIALDPVKGDQILSELSKESGVEIGELRSVLARGECSEVSERALGQLREQFDAEVPPFSVGFTSVASGLLLAIETIRLLIGRENPHDFSDSLRPRNSIFMQFLRPSAASNGRRTLGRDSSCPACAPGPRLEIWRERYLNF